MTTPTTNETLTRISKEADLLSSLAHFAAIATEPQRKQSFIDAAVIQWETLQRVMAEVLPEAEL